MPLTSIEQIRSVQWDKSNLWDIHIPAAIHPFDAWVPANDVEFGFRGIVNEAFGSASGLEFPKSTSYPTLTISYMDDEDLSMTMFLKEWQEGIVNVEGTMVKTVYDPDVSKTIIITKHNSKKENVLTINCLGYPTGQITYHGDSDGSTPIYSVQFTITASEVKYAW